MRYFLIAILALFSMPVSMNVWAQDNVEIYLENLEGYQPPPMFEGQKSKPKAPEFAPLTAPLPRYEISSERYEVKPAVSEAIPEIAPAPAAKPKTQKPKAVRAKKTPPLPPKRPDTFFASREFAQEVIENPKPSNPNIGAPDPLQNQLKEPTAKEVRDQIAEIVQEPLPPPEPKQPEGESAFISLGYDPGFTDLTDEVKQAVQDQFINLATAHPNKRIEVQAFASSEDGNESSARRIALSRALDIRSFLIESEIDPGRIDVRTLGSQTEKEPLDRVDIYLR